jgi:hypothetical protein
VNSHGANTQATEPYFIGNATSLFSISGLEVPLWPVVATIGLALLVILPSGYVYVVLTKRMSMPSSMALIVNHGVMLVIALAAYLGPRTILEIRHARRRSYSRTIVCPRSSLQLLDGTVLDGVRPADICVRPGNPLRLLARKIWEFIGSHYWT